MKENKKNVDDIVQMLDSLMDKGQGHINLTVSDSGDIEVDSVDITKQTDCDAGDVACKIPTMFYEDR
jgi:hypothetical protein